MKIDNVLIPKPEYIERTSLKGLYSLWLENHNEIIKYFQNNKIPMFAISGMNEVDRGDFLEDPCSIKAGTFYSMIENEKDLVSLYSMCNYASGLGFKPTIGRSGRLQDSGGILVFDLSNFHKTGKSLADKYLPDSGLSLVIGSDISHCGDLENLFFNLRNPGNQFWEQTLVMPREEFHDRFRGYLTPDQGDLYNMKMDLFGDGYVKTILSYRFNAQKVLSEVVDLLSNK